METMVVSIDDALTIVTLSRVMAGRASNAVMGTGLVGGKTEISKVIVGPACRADMHSLREPGPLSGVDVTTQSLGAIEGRAGGAAWAGVPANSPGHD
jgi:hypothetical protein